MHTLVKQDFQGITVPPCFYMYMYETEIQQIDINYEFPKN